MSTLVIRSEEDAWRLLAQVLDEEGRFPNNITFKGWPVLRVKIDPGDGRGTPEIVRALDKLQRYVYCAFALLKYGSADGRRLSRRDRYALALKHTITSGSTGLGIDVSGALKEFAREAGKNTNGRHLVAIALIVGLSIASASMWGAWLTHRAEIHRAEMQVETQKEFAALMYKQSDQHTQQIALVKSIVDRSELARYASADYFPWRPALLEIATAGSMLTINDSLKIAAAPAKIIAKAAAKAARAERKQLARAKIPAIGDWRTTTLAEPVSTLPRPPMRLGRIAST